MTDHPTEVERSMNTKLLTIMKGADDVEGGLTLTPAEATAFKLMMDEMHQLQQVFADAADDAARQG